MDVCTGLVLEMRCGSLIVWMCIITCDWCEVLCIRVFVVWNDSE